MTIKKSYAGILAGCLLSVVFGVAAPSAQAAERDGRCDAGEFCLYYNSGLQGSVSDFAGSISDYGANESSCFEFRGPGAGHSGCVKNSAASAWNRASAPVTVFFNSGYAGASQTIAAGARVNLYPALKNENASHRFGSASPGAGGSGPTSPSTGGGGATDVSFALYGLSGGRITAGYDGYKQTRGRHEGIDIVRSDGSPVRALLEGEVTNVVRGARGSGRLSTIAIYNAVHDATIVYLHTAPLASLSRGQIIVRGQRIATESWRGVGSASGTHTHVEMRPGRRTNAAYSVRDYRLDNPNPTGFWTRLGYRLR